MSNETHHDEIEIARRTIRRQALLDLLKDRKWHLNIELALPEYGGLSFNVHLKHLRDAGWIIDREHVEGGVHRYRLLRKGDPIDAEKTMSMRQRAVATAYVSAVKKLFDAEAAEQVQELVPEHYRAQGGDKA